MKKEEFISLLNKNNVVLSEKQSLQFEKYLYLLQEYNKVMNLTGITEEEEVYEKHFYDSLLFSFNENMENLSLIDVGSGAGFPGVPLAIAYPSLNVTLLEPLTKRCKFLEAVKSELGLTNVVIVNERAEDFSKKNEEKFDIATARAVSKLNILLEISSQMIKVNGYFVALKGKIAQEEIEQAKNALKVLNFKIEKNKEDYLPSEDDSRANIFIKKLGSTNKKYPRNYSQIKNRPL